MSNIPAARSWLKLARQPKITKKWKDIYICFALHHMTRVKAVTKARKKPVKITPAMRKTVRAMAKQGYSQAVIARKVGLSNPGRVSEILHGKR